MIEMGSEKKLRLGHVEGDVAVRLRETLAVQGVSIEDFTKKVVKEHLLRKSALDTTGQNMLAKPNPDIIRIIDDPVIRITRSPDKTIPLRHVNGLGLCIDCDTDPVPLVDMISEVLTEATTRNLRAQM